MDWWNVIGGIAMQKRDSESGTRGSEASEEYKQLQLRNPGLIGVLGPLMFQVSSWIVETFSDYSRKTRSRIASHDVLGGEKTVLEYVGGEASELTFKMTLNADLGVDVDKELLKLDSMVNSGVAYFLVLGGDVIGYNRWYVSEIGEKVIGTDRHGHKTVATVEVTLRESVL